MSPDERELPPRMPDEWVTQLRGALKEDSKKLIGVVLLGSSVVAAVVSAIAGLGLEFYKAHNQRKVEEYKVQLDMNKTQLNEVRALYAVLADKVRKFEKELDDSVGTCQLAIKNNYKQQFVDYAKASFDSVSESMEGLREATMDPRIDAEIVRKIDAMRDALAPKLASVDAPAQNMAELVSLSESKLKPALIDVKQRIQNAARSLKLTAPAS